MKRHRRSLAVTLVVAILLLAPPVDLTAPPPRTSARTLPSPRWEAAGRWSVGQVAPPLPASLSAGLGGTSGATVQVRVRRRGAWSAWRSLDPAGEHAPDPGTREAAGAVGRVTRAAWLGPAEAVQVRTDAAHPDRLVLNGVDLEGSPAWRPTETRIAPGAASALGLWPPVVPRRSWDPRGECQPGGRPHVSPTVRRVFVHHTAVFPHYRPEEADDLVRSICLQHVEHRGFNDIGYNFLIDQYGTIYQGRAGGILHGVAGAHAAGFNHGSVGVGVIGDFDSHPVPPAVRDSLRRLVTWLVDLHGLDPTAVTAHTSTGGETTRYAEGRVAVLPTILGHRDTGLTTTCPGDNLYPYVRGDGVGPGPLAREVAARLGGRAPGSADLRGGPSTGDGPAGPDPAGGTAPATLARLLKGLVEGELGPTLRRLAARGMAGGP